MSGDSDLVQLEIPASSAYLALARAATSSTCARLDLPVDRLEDLTLAVDEAASLLISAAAPSANLHCSWRTAEAQLHIELSCATTAGRAPRQTTFAWTVLSALVDDATAEYADGTVSISLLVTLPGDTP